jgi:hypothetical protein
MRVPTREELLDPVARDQVLADVAIALVAGEIGDKEASAIQRLCKEIRDNADLQQIYTDVKRATELVREVVRRATAGQQQDIDAVDGIVKRIMRGQSCTSKRK